MFGRICSKGLHQARCCCVAIVTKLFWRIDETKDNLNVVSLGLVCLASPTLSKNVSWFEALTCCSVNR